MLAVNGVLYSVVQFEAPLPSTAYMHQLSMSASGDLTVTPGSLTPIDFSPYGGLANTCAGSTTPWQCHLGGEESIVVNSRDFAGTFFPGQANITGFNTVSLTGLAPMMRHFGVYPATLTNAAVVNNLNPYMCVARRAQQL